MLRLLMTVLIVAAGASVALWQLGVIQPPFLQGGTNEAVSQSSLFDAVRTGDIERLEELVASGSPVDARDEEGKSPLVVAVREDADQRFVARLIELGADVNATDEAGWTPLMHAARHTDSAEVVQLLMFAAADPTIVNLEGESAADLARRNPAVASTRLLGRLQELEQGNFDTSWPSGYTVPVEGATISSRATHLPGARRAYRNGTHEGFDFYDGTVSVTIEYGTGIHAVADGEVIRADHDYQELTAEEYDQLIVTAQRNLTTPDEILDKLRGRQVWIRHPGGFVSRYAHLSAISEGVREGVAIRQGDLIGATGNSGTLEAVQGTRDDPHPHVEIWRGDAYLGQGLSACEIYPLAAQLFGQSALPPYTETCS